ncbi:6-pyruvoyl tetrahydrobiopterin synthase-like [Clavelina lepadiformis]|uniref:6-pyruvoyltetrahydropterin synthase n=1 Tax=Clavelina lepadiformis TaxID=159417 RepID=A0ABP0FNU0_CLALP
MSNIVELSRRIMLCASHRLHSTHLSDEENKQLYGKCNNPNGHGHNYVIKVSVRGEKDPITGMVMDAAILKDYMTKAIMDVMDHKCLDKDVEYFKTQPSTAENIAVFVWNQLSPYMEKEKCSLHKVKIFETENICATYKGMKA